MMSNLKKTPMKAKMVIVAMANPVMANPVTDKVVKVLTDGFDPYVLTPDECGKILNMCAEKHPIALPLLTLNLFCGIRPSECRRLNTSSGRNSNFRWEDKEIVMQAHKSKTKMRRSVEMSDNCFAWLKLTEFSLPIPSATHHWDNFLSDAKKLLGYDKWPHDCLRYSYCSYALPKNKAPRQPEGLARNSCQTTFKGRDAAIPHLYQKSSNEVRRNKKPRQP